MKEQISNSYIPGKREQFLFTLLTALAIAALYFIVRNNTGFSIIKFFMATLLMLMFFSAGYFVSYGRFYRVETDREYLYFSRFLKQEKLEINRIISVELKTLKMSFLYRSVYCVKVNYMDKQRKEKKFKFLSVESRKHQKNEKLKSLHVLQHLIRKKAGV